MKTLTQRHVELEDVNGDPFRFEGYLLGEASSQDDAESKPRWMEVRIYQVHPSGRYVTEVLGQTQVSGETVKARTGVHPTAGTMIDALYTRRRDFETGQMGEPYLTYTARDALYDAMDNDPDVLEAWEARARNVA